MLFDNISNWVHCNYHASYLLGISAIACAAWSLDPKREKHGKYHLGAFLAALAFGVVAEPCVNVQSQRYGPALVRGTGKEKLVALTFDDGPSEFTEPLLDVLAEAGVKVSFFCEGRKILERPELVMRAYDEGHLVGTHSFSHRNLLFATPSSSREEIAKGAEALNDVLGVRPLWFRPPYGMRYPWTLLQARSEGMSAVLWSNCPRDWMRPGAEVIAQRVMEELQPGDVVLLHDGGGDRSQTVEAVRRLIVDIRDRGYEFVRVDQMR